MEAAWGRFLLHALLLYRELRMNENSCFLNCGNIVLRYSFIYPETARYFGRYLTNDPKIPTDCDVCVTPEFMNENRWLVDEEEESSAFLEFQSLMLATGNALLAYRRALFHGAAFLWKGRAWIFTAPSGTGKTTQLNHWRRLWRKEIRVINGDKPCLECRDDGSVFVYSSPWRGKERSGMLGLSAPLGGIVLLEQGPENRIRRMTPQEAVRPFFSAFISFPDHTWQIRCQSQILEQMLDAVPVWKLTNIGDEASARLTQKTLMDHLEGGS